MRKFVLSGIMAAFAALMLPAQVLQVSSMEKVRLPQGVLAEQALLSPDGSKIALTDMAGTLRVVDRTANTVATVSTSGSMMNLAFNADGTAIAYREATIGSDRLRRVAVNNYVIATGRNVELLAPSRNLQAISVNGNIATTIADGAVRAAAMSGSRMGAPAAPTAKAVPGIERGRMYLTVDGRRILCSPLGTEGMSYLWPSVSPDGSKLLFFAAGYGTYTCNLDGSDLKSLGYLYAPVWYDDETVVGMRTEDDGRVTYKGEIVAATADGSAFQTLTEPSLVAVLPSAYPGKIAFTTTEGEMYILNVSK